MAGAHLDSVAAGPGINDNGSGSSALSRWPSSWRRSSRRTSCASPGGAPRRPAWSARRTTSTSLTEEELRRHRAVPELRHGRLAQLRAVHLRRRRLAPSGRGGPDGSDDIEALFERYYAERDIPSEPTPSTAARTTAVHQQRHPGRRPVHRRRGLKTAEQVEQWGGTAGVAFDPCYHAACDTSTTSATTRCASTPTRSPTRSTSTHREGGHHQLTPLGRLPLDALGRVSGTQTGVPGLLVARLAGRPVVEAQLDQLAGDAGVGAARSQRARRQVGGQLDEGVVGPDVDVPEVAAARGRPRWRARRRSGAARPCGACRRRSGTSPSGRRPARAGRVAAGRGRRGAPRSSPRSPRSLGRAAGRARGSGSSSSGSSPWSTTASAAATSTSGTLCSRT